MGSIQLHPKDAEQFGVDEVTKFNLDDIGRKQRRAFEAQTGRSLSWLYDELGGKPELDEAGNPIPVPVLNEDGSPKLNDDGTPAVEPKLVVADEAVDMFVYLILWAHGVRMAWDDFELRDRGLWVRFSDEQSDEAPGKADEPTTDSESTPNS